METINGARFRRLFRVLSAFGWIEAGVDLVLPGKPTELLIDVVIAVAFGLFATWIRDGKINIE